MVEVKLLDSLNFNVKQLWSSKGTRVITWHRQHQCIKMKESTPIQPPALYHQQTDDSITTRKVHNYSSAFFGFRCARVTVVVACLKDFN